MAADAWLNRCEGGARSRRGGHRQSQHKRNEGRLNLDTSEGNDRAAEAAQAGDQRHLLDGIDVAKGDVRGAVGRRL